jgi:hypothetical protein
MSSKLKYPEYFLKESEKNSAEGKESMTLLKQMQNLKINKYARYLKGALNNKDIKKKVNIPSGKKKKSRNELQSNSKEIENNRSTLIMYPEDEEREGSLNGNNGTTKLDSSILTYVKNHSSIVLGVANNSNCNSHRVICDQPLVQIASGASGTNNLEVILEQETQRTDTLNSTIKKTSTNELQINYTNCSSNAKFNNSKTEKSGKSLKSTKTDFSEQHQDFIKENSQTNISTSLNSSLQINPQYTVDYLLDIYHNLLDEQIKVKPISGYMNLQTDINEKMRAIIVDWIIDVHFKFKLTPETLFLTVYLIDRYLSERNLKRDHLQLIGVVSLLIACKYEEIFSPELRDFEYITDKAFTKEEFTQLEMDMLKLFDFEITVPSSFRFFEIMSTILKFSQIEFCFGRYLLEMFLIDYRYTKYSASQIACSVCFLVLSFKSEKLCEKTFNNTCRKLHKFLLLQMGQVGKRNQSGDDKLDKNREHKELFVTKSSINFFEILLKDCCKDITFILENIDNTGLSSVKKKFMTQEFFKVARLSSKLGI